MTNERADAAEKPSPPAEVGGVVERAEALVDCGCLDGGLSIVRELACALSAQAEEIERLRRELEAVIRDYWCGACWKAMSDQDADRVNALLRAKEGT